MSIASCGHVKMVFQKPGSGIKGELCWLVEGECSSDNSNPAPPCPPPLHTKELKTLYTSILEQTTFGKIYQIKSFEDLTFSAI